MASRIESIRSSKKGFTKTIISIFALLFLIFIFIVFIALFSISKANKENGVIDASFSSTATELLLKNFLRMPLTDVEANPPKDMTSDVGEQITNADLVAWTCDNDKKSQNSVALQESLNAFFDNVYKNDWEAWIIYSDDNVDKKGFGHTSYLNAVWTNIKTRMQGSWMIFKLTHGLTITKAEAEAFLSFYRGPGFGSQIIPCTDGGKDVRFAKVMLYSHSLLIKIIRASV